MIEIPFWAAEAALALVWIALRAALWLRRKKIDWKREALLLLMYVNLAVLLRITFFPMAHRDGRIQPLLFYTASAWLPRLNLIPFVRLRDFAYRRDLLLNVIGNTAMFIPSGILLPILYKRLDGFFKTLAAGASISLGIEVLQLPFSVRSTDVDDLILNTLGAAIGYGIFAAVRGLVRLKKKYAPRRSDPHV